MRAVLAIPAVLLAVTVIYIVANPTGQSVGQVPVTPTDTPEPTATPTAEPTSTPTVAPLPPGLSGRFTYRSDGELITVQFPLGDEARREPALPASPLQPSPDGLWNYNVECEPKCSIYVSSADGQTVKSTGGGAGAVEWSPEGHTLAYVFGSGDVGPTGSPSQELMLVEDPGAGGAGVHTSGLQSRLLFRDDGHILTFEWIDAENLLVSVADGPDARFVRVPLAGEVTPLATVPSPVFYLHPAPGGGLFAFTVNDAAGWRLNTIDPYSGAIRDLGNMGSDPAGVNPPSESADNGKGPIYIAWSPDGTRLAFGGGFTPPYTMTTVDVATGALARTEFPFGYPGEIKWSPDGGLLAISTYDPDRTRHESYVVDPVTGSATHLARGCIIVWSPDSRFLAVHGEPEPGISIVDVATGAQGKLTQSKNDTPLTWEP